MMKKFRLLANLLLSISLSCAIFPAFSQQPAANATQEQAPLKSGSYQEITSDKTTAEKSSADKSVTPKSAESAKKADTADGEFSDDELAQMLAPIALYPDSLLTHVLIASTYPLEIVEAHRWADKNKSLSKEDKVKIIEDQEWEPSVKAIAPFEQVLTRMNDELSWTQDLGDAFLQDEERVLATIQTLRVKAEEAGNLEKMENVEVTTEDNNIIITPVEKEIIYVPYYDTRYVYGHWYWHYPPVYWHYPSHHHGPRVVFSWHRGVHISFNYHFSAFHWHKRHVVVVNHRNTRHYRHNTVIIKSGHSARWKHKPSHRKGVAYRTPSVKKHYGSNRPSTIKVKSHNRVVTKSSQVKKTSTVSKTQQSTHQRVSQNLANKKALPKVSQAKSSQVQSAKAKNVNRGSQQNRIQPNKSQVNKSQVNKVNKAKSQQYKPAAQNKAKQYQAPKKSAKQYQPSSQQKSRGASSGHSVSRSSQGGQRGNVGQNKRN